MPIKVEAKPVSPPVSPGDMRDLKTYRVTEVLGTIGCDEINKHVNVGDILFCIQGYFNNTHCIINATTGQNLTGWQNLSRIKCVRDFTVKRIELYCDENELPA